LETILFVACVGLVLMLLSLAFYEGYHLRRIHAGVRALDVGLGGMSVQQAVAALPEGIDPYLAQPLRLRYRDQVWDVTAAQVGVRFDRPAMTRLAYRVGRGHGIAADLRQQWNAYRVGHDVPYELVLDQDTAYLFLTDLANQINRPARDATLEVRDLSPVTSPSQVGRTLDLEISQHRIFTQLGDLSGGDVELVVHEIPPALDDVSLEARQIERILSEPIVLKLPVGSLRTDASPPGPWVISRELLASALRTERRAARNPVRLVVRLEADTFRPQIQLLAEKLAIHPRNARLVYDSDRNAFTELTPSAWGQWLDVEATLQQVLIAAEAREREVTLSLIPEKPTVSAGNAHHLGIQELVAESTTSFRKSSRARMQNIAIAASRFHGVVVQPDQTFSFNEHLGEVSAEAGYEESLIIVGDRTRVGIGGGICQVATTAFRAAFWGGYPIEERWAHGYRVRAYEPPVGLDATVYAPFVDFRFRNDTRHHVLVQTETDLQARTVTFRFYSTSIGRHADMEEPVIENRVPHGPDIIEEDPSLPVGTHKQVDWAVDGLDTTIVRRVYQGKKLLREDVFFSRYRPWQARFRVGTMSIEKDASNSDQAG